MKFSYKETGLIDQTEVLRISSDLKDYVVRLSKVAEAGGYDHEESSINLPADKTILADVADLKKHTPSKRLKYLVVVGIGGSNLGTKAIYDSLLGAVDILEPKRFPKIIFADTTDGQFLARLQVLLQKQVRSPLEVLVNVISKSGSTTETIVNAEIILSALKARFGDKAMKRLVITTDEGSALWNMSEDAGWPKLALPAKVGGRYSVFSAVGLFPLSFLPIKLKNLLAGAVKARRDCLSGDMSANPAVLSAVMLYSHYKKGKNINDNFFFQPELESLGKWYRQLMGESIGKEKDRQGATINAGITPTVSIGSTDLHSMGQLYLGGPRDKFTTFAWATGPRTPKVPRQTVFNGLVSDIENKSGSDILSAIYQGVKAAYVANELPFCELDFGTISEESVGYYLQFKMIEIMMLGKLLNLNAFDQPNVESYKIETKRILASI